MTPAPRRLADYEVLSLLASGGVGDLLLARPPEDRGALVALKRAHPHLVHDPSVRSMMISEARWLLATHSPYVIRLLDLVAAPGELILALEYIHGVSLAFLLDAYARAGKVMPTSAALRILLDTLRGLEAIHRAEEDGAEIGLVHCDLNPRNVLVGLDGRSRLCDLGLASPEQPATSPTSFRGTAAYTAPEVWRGTGQTRRSDLFSAGVVLWETLRGQRLFRGRGVVATLENVVHGEAPALDQDLPHLAPLALLVARALAKDPTDRPATAREIADAIEQTGPVGARSEVEVVVERCAGAHLAARLAPLPPSLS
jgi:serine/threonine-protein kinase